MKLLVVQYEDRMIQEFQPLLHQNKTYCSKNGIEYFFLNSGYENYPPWWRKVFLVKEILPSYDAVMWVDSDAAIVSNKPFSDLFEKNHFVLSPNPPMFGSKSLSMFSAPFCAGVWGVKNTPEGNTIMKTWSNSYDPKSWEHDKKLNTWKCIRGPYAGPSYEQGAFEISIWRKKDFYRWIENKPSEVLNYLPKPDNSLVGKHCPNGIFAVHYWKGNRKHISQHWSLLTT